MSPPPAPAPKAPSPTNYGFVPVKTRANYVQQEAPTSYLQQYNQYTTGQTQSYTSPQYSQEPQYTQQPQYVTQYSQPDYSQYSTIAYSGDGSQLKYTKQDSAQKYTEVKFISQPAITYAQNDYQNLENVQYITDNSISQQQEPVHGQSQSGQQYYSPQYIYLQQYQAPSTSVRTVVEPKGELNCRKLTISRSINVGESENNVIWTLNMS